MTVKKIELNDDQRNLIRELICNEYEELSTELIKGSFVNDGILYACERIQLTGQIIEKLNFEVIK